MGMEGQRWEANAYSKDAVPFGRPHLVTFTEFRGSGYAPLTTQMIASLLVSTNAQPIEFGRIWKPQELLLADCSHVIYNKNPGRGLLFTFYVCPRPEHPMGWSFPCRDWWPLIRHGYPQ